MFPIWIRIKTAYIKRTGLLGCFIENLSPCRIKVHKKHVYIADQQIDGCPCGSLPCSRVLFIPLVAKTLGGLSNDTIDTITSISRLQGQRFSIPPSESTRHLFQYLAIALWWDNAMLRIRRQPVGQDHLVLKIMSTGPQLLLMPCYTKRTYVYTLYIHILVLCCFF